MIPTLFSLSEAKADIDRLCPVSTQCPLSENYELCATSHITDLMTSSRISIMDFSILTDDLSSLVTYCNGFNECNAHVDIIKNDSYNTGFTAGVASVDQDGIRKAGFDAGVASVDVNPIKTEAYQSGFSAGVASVDVEAIRQEGVNQGIASVDIESIKKAAFQAGVNSIDIENLRANAYEEGVASVDTEGLKAQSYQEGFDAGKSSVQCENESGKITICHISGKKRQTIQISKRALKSHLNHGDTLGECVNAKSSKK